MKFNHNSNTWRTRAKARLIFALLVLGLGVGGLPAGSTTNSPLPKAARYSEIKEKWSKVSPEELRKAADLGVADAQMYFGASEWIAAQEDNHNAFQWRTIGVPTPQDIEQSQAKWQSAAEPDVERAAQSGDQSARLFLGKLRSGRATARGREAFVWIKKAAEQSLVPAEEEVAKQYLGLGSWAIIPTDELEGMKWLQRAADHDSEWAQHKLADFFLSGRSAAPDLIKGLEQLQRVVDKDCPRGQYQLAMLYANGNGEPRNPGETPVELLKKSAHAGYNYALAALADRYRMGFGTDLNFVVAARLYRAAIEAEADFGPYSSRRSHVETILSLLDENLEVKPKLEPNLARFAHALSLYSKATEQKDASAMYEIGQLYHRGVGVPKDAVEAYKWFSQAADRGNSTAAVSRDKLKTSLSAEDLKKAQEGLQEFKSPR